MTQLENELQNLQTRRDEIAREISNAQADIEAAREAVIAGAPAIELQSARAKLATLQEVADELDRRINQKAHDLKAASDAQAHADAVALVKERAQVWTEQRSNLLTRGQEIVGQITAILPYLLDLSRLADEHRAIVQLGQREGVSGHEVDLSFDYTNAHSLFLPLYDKLTEEADKNALSDVYRRYANAASIAEGAHRIYATDTQGVGLRPSLPFISQEGGTSESTLRSSREISEISA